MDYRTLFYFDIETVGQYKDFETFKSENPRGAALFQKKYDNTQYMKENSSCVDEAYLSNSALHPVYGKIICFSYGYFTDKNEKGYTISSYYSHNERELITKIVQMLDRVSLKPMLLSGYGINFFDVPYLVHKINKYDFKLPLILDNYDKKPWEIKTFDLSEKWKAGFKYYTSLDEVCYEMDIDSPKDDISGSEVHEVYWGGTYWNDDNLIRIKTYCEKDVYSSMLVGKKMLQ